MGGGGGYVGALFTIEEQKKVDYDAMNSCATHAGFAHDVTDTGCMTQNGMQRTQPRV